MDIHYAIVKRNDELDIVATEVSGLAHLAKLKCRDEDSKLPAPDIRLGQRIDKRLELLNRKCPSCGQGFSTEDVKPVFFI